MIYIFSPDATPAELLTNGHGILECSSCSVYEELNGEFSCFVSIPLDTKNEEYFVGDAILKIPTHRGVQYFRLQVPEVQLTGKTATGYHISYDMSNDMILNGYIAASDGDTALNYILHSGTYENRFSGSSDISIINNARIVRTPLLSALMDGGRNNSFVSRWGGEIERDNFTFNINARLGADNGARVSYKKNLSGLRITEDYTKIATRIYPTCLKADDTILVYSGSGSIDSAELSTYPLPKIKHIHYSDIKVGQEVDGSILYPDEASAIAEMLARVQALYASGQDKPQVTVEASVANLPEYSALNLGDTVKGGFRDWVFDHRVVSVNYDGLYDRMISVTLGAVKSSFQGTMYAQSAQVQAISDSLEGVVFQGEKYNEVYIDHTDGFVAECSVLNSKMVANGSKIGFYNMTTGDFIGGLTNIGGNVGLIAQKIAGTEDPTVWAQIGNITGGGFGLELVHKTGGKFFLVARLAGGGFALLDENETVRFYADDDATRLYDAAGVTRFSAGATATRLYDADGVTRFYADDTATRLYDADEYERLRLNSTTNYSILRAKSGSSHNEIGVDETGAYKIIAGTKTYLPVEFLGKATGVSSSAWTSVNFPYPYFPAGADVHVLLSVETTDAGVIAPKFRNVSTSGFEVTIGGSGFSGITVHWRAFASQ